MRKTLFVSVICLLASAAVVGEGKLQPLNIKPGQWQVTKTYSATGLPAGMPSAAQTITYKNCVTQKDLATNPFNDPNDKCAWTILNSTSSDMEVKGTSCSFGRNQEMKANVHLKLHVVDSEHVNGSGDWTASGNGMSMSGNATGTGKWVSATCSAE
jgi:hypothetical protein